MARLTIAIPQAPAGRRLPPALAVLLRRKIAVLGAVLMVLTTAVGLLAPVIAGNPTHMDVAARLGAPSPARWFGTHDLGPDGFSPVGYGARLSLLVGTTVVVLTFGGGVRAGLRAGYFRAPDNPIMR